MVPHEAEFSTNFLLRSKSRLLKNCPILSTAPRKFQWKVRAKSLLVCTWISSAFYIVMCLMVFLEIRRLFLSKVKVAPPWNHKKWIWPILAHFTMTFLAYFWNINWVFAEISITWGHLNKLTQSNTSPSFFWHSLRRLRCGWKEFFFFFLRCVKFMCACAQISRI